MEAKKIRNREFRYLKKKHVKDPLSYIRHFFEFETDILSWKQDLHLLLNAVTCPEMHCPGFADNAYICKMLIGQVEAAFVIYHRYNLPVQDSPLKFFATREDYLRFVYDGTYVFNGKVDPLDLISKFFSYRNLEKWYDILDDFWMGLAAPINETHDRFGDEVLVIRELLMRLAQAMYDMLGWSEFPKLKDTGGAELPPVRQA